ncbi:hypothetical protein BDZ89DRAFT_1068162 [Hymenopellis radicata]|nr:hypothetical protein BDZ89DRAFT_1068162 [Hymenopellis radicata]
MSLPPELVEHIISFIWCDPLLSTTQRVQFMTSSLLVNRSWAATFMHVSARDVYIPTTPFLRHFRKGDTYIAQLLNDNCTRMAPKQRCKSITITARSWLGEKAWTLEIFFLLYGGAMPNVERVTSITWTSPDKWKRTDTNRMWAEAARVGLGLGIVGQVCSEGSLESWSA